MTREKWMSIGILLYVLVMFVSLGLAQFIPLFIYVASGMGIAVGILTIILILHVIITDTSSPPS